MRRDRNPSYFQSVKKSCNLNMHTVYMSVCVTYRGNTHINHHTPIHLFNGSVANVLKCKAHLSSKLKFTVLLCVSLG